jgi:hypothetical protein
VGTVKITSWNVAHLDRLVKEDLSDFERRRRDAVVRERIVGYRSTTASS